MFKSLLSASLLAFLVAQLAKAHFTLEYPQTRGFNEDIEDDNFCGGFHDVSATRSPWYYKDGPVAIESHHDTSTVNIYASFDQTPTGPESFLKTSSGSSIPTLRNDLKLTGEGYFCFTAKAEGLDVPGVEIKDGTNATLLVEFISTHGHLYQCADVTFTSDASVSSNVTCTNALTATAQGESHDHGDKEEEGHTQGGKTNTTASSSSATAASVIPSQSAAPAAAGSSNGALSLSASAVASVAGLALGLALLA